MLLSNQSRRHRSPSHVGPHYHSLLRNVLEAAATVPDGHVWPRLWAFIVPGCRRQTPTQTRPLPCRRRPVAQGGREWGSGRRPKAQLDPPPRGTRPCVVPGGSWAGGLLSGCAHAEGPRWTCGSPEADEGLMPPVNSRSGHHPQGAGAAGCETPTDRTLHWDGTARFPQEVSFNRSVMRPPGPWPAYHQCPRGVGACRTLESRKPRPPPPHAAPTHAVRPRNWFEF